MDIKLLNAFLTLAEHGQFGRAAGVLCVTQPTLSKQILALEQQLGGRLFERGKHGAVLSRLGELLLPEARALIDASDRLVQRAQLACQGERGTLRIGFGLSTLSLAPQWVAAFRARFPDVMVTLNDLPSDEQARRLISGELDLGFVRKPAVAALRFLPLMVERLALSAPAQSPWRALPRDLAQLNAHGVVKLARARGPGLDDQVARWCAGRGFTPRVVQEADDIQTVQALVCAGIGVAFLPASAQLLLAGGSRTLPLKGDGARWDVGLAWRPAALPATAQRFVEMLRQADDVGSLSS